ncbi:PAS domain-containing protein [Mangrovicoccus sp. HB161399]|uniref:PAS domain-containing protein n=1 Tax=Mangrovicoccus sp. HB161399 TaxID=2720392 RepID=UPI0020A6989B|nr:PAS domain-containing protein [Mangrovicoccus sp. HB161399]
MANDGTQDQDIVSLKSYKTTMQHSAISQLEAYWHGLRNGRVVPNRSDVDPRGIDRALEYAFILERIAPGMARFRLAGMHLNDLMGMEVRGMPLTSFFVPDARRQVSDALEHVFEEPSIARFDLLAERGIGKPQNEAQLLILPLKSDLGDVSRALGCLVYDGEIGRTPRRFSVTEMSVEPLIAGIEPASAPLLKTGLTLKNRRAEDAPKPALPLSGFAEDKAPFGNSATGSDGKPGKPTRVPWLRVVTSED